jgi:hypothetical protein
MTIQPSLFEDTIALTGDRGRICEFIRYEGHTLILIDGGDDRFAQMRMSDKDAYRIRDWLNTWLPDAIDRKETE